jgi:hypothetical protein
LTDLESSVNAAAFIKFGGFRKISELTLFDKILKVIGSGSTAVTFPPSNEIKIV